MTKNPKFAAGAQVVVPVRNAIGTTMAGRAIFDGERLVPGTVQTRHSGVADSDNGWIVPRERRPTRDIHGQYMVKTAHVTVIAHEDELVAVD